MKHSKQNRRSKHVGSVALAGVLSLGTMPAWAQQSEHKSQSRHDAGAEDAMITASALEGTRVLDKRNREIGSISNLFIEPQSGKIVRAGIEFDKGTFGGQKYSVAWDQMSIKRQDGEIVVALDESVIDRVQNASRSDSGGGREGMSARQQREDRTQQRADRGSGVLDWGGDTSEKDQQQMSASKLNSEQIRKIQQELSKEGFHAGQVNGQWSSETQSALRNFQESKGLRATGQLDERTINELGLDADEMRQGGQTRSDRSFREQSYLGSSGSENSSGTQQYPGSSSENSFKDQSYSGSGR